MAITAVLLSIAHLSHADDAAEDAGPAPCADCIDCVAGIVQRNYTKGCSCANGVGGDNDCAMDEWCKLGAGGALPGTCVKQCEFDRNAAECVCGTTLMAELCGPKDMCVGEDVKCSNLGDEPRRECRVAGRRQPVNVSRSTFTHWSQRLLQLELLRIGHR